MPFALIATDINKDYCIDQNIRPALKSIGIESEIVFPAKKCMEVIRTLSIAYGRVDIVLILQTGAYSSGTSNPLQIISAIRAIDDKYTFQGSIKAKSIPILTIIDKPEADSFDLYESQFSWFRMYDLIRSNKRLSDSIIELLCQWRADILSELECIGYSITIENNGDLSVNPTFSRKEAEGEILARSTSIQKLRKSKYLILSKDLLADLSPYKELQFLLNNYREIAKKDNTKPEEVFQKFFERYPSFILRDQFDQHWARPRLRLPEKDGKYLEPDFVLKPRVAELMGTKWEILDIKLPEAKITTKTTFHPSFSSNIIKAVQQLYDYREYFNRSDAKRELIERFGFAPRNPRLAILIGREMNLDPAVVSDVQGKFKMLDIEFITYDELLESHAKQIILQSDILKEITGYT